MKLLSPRILFMLAALAAPAAGQDSAAVFGKGYESYLALVEGGKWEQAYDRIRSLLDQHPESDVARDHREEILETIEDCVFYKQYQVPELRELSSAKRFSYNARTGKVDLVYERIRAEDFEVQEGDATRNQISVFYHPAIFDGAYNITVTGDSYPADGVRLFVAMQGNAHYDVSFGWMSGSQYVPAALRWNDGEHGEELDERVQTPLKTGRRFKVSVDVGKTKIVGKAGGRPILETKRKRGPFGSFAIKHSDWAEVRIKGKIQPAWLQGLRDRHRQEQRTVFEQGYDATRHVPAWLLTSAATDSGTERSRKVYPGRVPARAVGYLNTAMDLFNQGEHAAVVDLLATATDADAPAPARAYLLALAETELDHLESAHRHLEVAAEADPDFAGVRSLRGQLHAAERRWEDAVRELRAGIASSPTHGELYAALARVLLECDRLDEAERVLADAESERATGRDLEQLANTLRKARKGPAWPAKYEYEGKNYVVASDIDQDVCRDAVKVLEQAFLMYQQELGWIPAGRDARKFRVFLFSGEQGYQSYVSDILGSRQPHTAGLYSPILKQLVIWNLPDRESRRQTVRHEGFHQYLDRVMSSPPVWLNEGLAEFYERAERERGRLRGGQVREDHVEVLQRKPNALVPLERFVVLSPGQFYENAELHYAQAWALVCFLRQTTSVRRTLLANLFESLQTEKGSSQELIRRAFEGVDYQKLDTEFAAYVAGGCRR